MSIICPGPTTGGGGGGVTSVFVYRPGGVAADNVYDDWSTLMTAVDGVEGLRTIQFDDSLATVTIPSGAWDMTDVVWSGKPIAPFAQADRTAINVSEGATFPGLRRVSGGLLILNNATATTPVTVSDGVPFRLEGTQLSQGTGTVPFIDFDYAGFGALLVSEFGTVNQTDGPPATPNVLWSAGFGALILEAARVGPSAIDNTSGNAISVLQSNHGAVAQGFQDSGVAPFLDLSQYSTFRVDIDRALSTDAARDLAPLNFGGAGPVMDLIARQDTTAAAHTVTLADPEDRPGQIQGVKNEAGGNDVTVEPPSGKKIDGVVDQQVVLRPGEVALFAPDGVDNWTTIGRGHSSILSAPQVVLDVDGDSLILSSADDVIDFHTNGVRQLRITASEIRADRVINTVSGLRPNAAGGADLGTVGIPYGALFLQEGGTGLVLDSDGDSYLVGTSDDAAQWYFGNVRRATWGSGSFDFNIPLRPESNNQTTLGGDFRGWSRLYLGNAGTYTADVSEVAPTTPNAQAAIFHAEGPSSSKELWVRHADGSLKQLDAEGGGGSVETVSGFITCHDTTAGSPSMPTDGTAFTLGDSDGDGNIDYDSVTGRWTLKADTPYALQAEIRIVGVSGDLGKYRFYDVTNSTYIGLEGFNQEENRSTGAASAAMAVAQLKPTTDVEIELRNTTGNSTGTYTGDLSKAWIFSTGGVLTAGQAKSAFAVESIEGAVGSADGGQYATSGVEYLTLRQGEADTIEFQFIASGDFSVELVYAMSVANGGDIDLRLDSLAVADGEDSNAALATGTVTTFVPGSDTDRHTAASANFAVTAQEGDLCKILIQRPDTDTHTGDVRVTDIRVRAAVSGLATESDDAHKERDQLVHEVAEDSYEEITYSGGNVSTVIIYTDNGKTTKIRETAYTYSGGAISTITTIQYNAAGAVVSGQTMTETLTYSGGALASIDRVMS